MVRFVTCVLKLSDIPCLPGVIDLVVAGYQTRATESNRSFAESSMRVEGNANPNRMDLVFDAQTGGLLISLPPEQAGRAVHQARNAGADAATIVGWVEERQEESLVLKGD